MKLLIVLACHLANTGGNLNKMTVMGEILRDRLSDRGSTPLRSTKINEINMLEERKCFAESVGKN